MNSMTGTDDFNKPANIFLFKVKTERLEKDVKYVQS